MDNNIPKIKVIGVGGAGCNAVDHMIEETINGVEFYGLNTDLQALEKTNIPNKLQIGKNLTKGLGAGAEPSIGKQSAEEDREAIEHILEQTDMVFVTAGMGGGTGTGAAPECAKYAREKGILTIGVVTKPFDFENRNIPADQGIKELSKNVDSLIVIPNQKLLSALDSNITMLDAFSQSNEVLLKSVRGIAELLTKAGIVNVDFADVKRVMGNSGNAMMGLGISDSENKVEEATMQAINSELLENESIKGSKSLLVNVSGNIDLSLNDYNTVGKIIKEYADPDAVIISGMTINHELNNNIIVTVVATNLINEFTKEKNIDKEFPYHDLGIANLSLKTSSLINDINKKEEINDCEKLPKNNESYSEEENEECKETNSFSMPDFLLKNDN